MGFRDDELAGRERVHALEQELAALKAENAALKVKQAAPQPKARSPRPAKLALPIGSAALVAAVGAAIAPLPPPARIALAMVAVIALMVAAMLALIGRLLHVVEPGRILVLSGATRTGPDGQPRGYRVVTQGRVLRLPLVESALWMELGPFPFTLELRGLFARGQRTDLRASAAVAVSTSPARVEHAVERFLGRATEEIVEVARQTLEGALRAVVAESTLDALRSDTPRVTKMVRQVVSDDFEKLGLELPTLVIEEVSATPEG